MSSRRISSSTCWRSVTSTTPCCEATRGKRFVSSSGGRARHVLLERQRNIIVGTTKEHHC
eukprot:1186158-Prorocentrum_minimum.AAC.1